MLTKNMWPFLYERKALTASAALLLVLFFRPSTAQALFGIWSSNGPNAAIESVVADPNDSNIIYAWGFTGLFKSVNNGASWSRSDQGMNSSSIRGLAIDPSDPNKLYAGSSGVFTTSNGGASWSRINSPEVGVGGISVAPSDPNVIYAETFTDKFLVTTNGGETWDFRSYPSHDPPWAGADSFVLTVDPKDPSVIYTSICDLADFCGLYKSTNGGTSWTRLPLTSATYALKVYPGDPNIIYTATVSGVYKSTNGGASWTLGGSPGHTRALAIDPLHPGTMYAGVTSLGVYKSTDDGATWSAFNNGLTNLSVQELTFDGSGTFLHAATQAGVFSVRVAANASVSGRVLTPYNRGLSNATVLMTDASGTTRIATTSTFGYYSFIEVPIGGSYSLGVRSRRFRFATRNFTLTDDLTDLDLIGID